MKDTPYKCRRCGMSTWLLFVLQTGPKPVVARCLSCGYEELL